MVVFVCCWFSEPKVCKLDEALERMCAVSPFIAMTIPVVGTAVAASAAAATFGVSAFHVYKRQAKVGICTFAKHERVVTG